MDLLEHEGKELFRRHGIAVPRGALWPDLPAEVSRYVVKAQIRAGKRGKQGGILFPDSAEDAAADARALAEATIAGTPVEAVYIEERLAIAREIYLAVVVDRDARAYTAIVSPDGGMDIEAVPAERILRLPIDPVIGLGSHGVRRMLRFLEAPEDLAPRIGETIRALYDLVVEQDALLAEINPLVITEDGAVIAADAKVTLDERAGFRHPEWAGIRVPETGTQIERAMLQAGGAAAELDPGGSVVGVISGAGLMMATLDTMIAMGVRVRCVIDMGGTPLGGAEGLVPIFKAVAEMDPKITLINAYFHTALADSFAEGVLGAAATAPLPGRVFLRLAGRNAAEGSKILAPLGFESHATLRGSLAAVAEAAAALE